MIIKEIGLNHFGKFSDTTISLSPGINVIYGPNESGKTTIFTAIGALLFGIEKKRGKAAQSDMYTTYQPWEHKTWYEAGMRFETGGKSFFLKRSFYQGEKSAVLICETDGEELSVEDGDLKMLLGDTEAELFFNTAATAQLRTKPAETVYGYLKNYIGSLEEAGNHSVDVVGALSFLEKKKKILEQGQKKRILEIKQQIAETGSRRELLRKEYSDCMEQANRLEEQLKALDREQNSKRKNFWQKLLDWILKLFQKNRLQREEQERRQEKIKISERIQLLRELAGEKEIYLEEAELEKEDLYQKLHEESKAEELRALELAMERIREISAVREEEVMGRLLEKASEVLCTMTGGKYQKMILEENLELKVWDGLRMLRLFQVSTGCADQIYLSFRIALQDLFFEEETLPLLFDDAFVYFDDRRLSHMLQCLETLGRQTLIFTCHDREWEILKGQGMAAELICLSN